MPAPQLAIITTGCAAQVEACLASYLAAHRTPPAGVLVLNDSRAGIDLSNDFEGARNIARHASIPFRCASRGDRSAYIHLLAARGIPRQVAEFCLLGLNGDWFTAGANRNAALLDLTGDTLLMVDDDTRGQTAGSPLTGDWKIAGNNDPTDIQVFSSREEACRSAPWQEADLIGDVARVLGSRPVSAQDGTVRVVACGVVGDSGFFSPAHLLWNASPSTTAQLRKSPESLAVALSSREVIRIAPQPALTRGTVCMATAIGLDHRELLPPFLPIGRNEDGVFGNLFLRCFPQAWTAHLPYAIFHAAREGRSYGRLPDQPQTIRLSELVIILLSTCPADDAAGPAALLSSLARHLRLVARSPRDLQAYSREAVRAQRRHLLSSIEAHIEEAGESSALWRESIGSLMARLRELIDSPGCWVPLELPALSPMEAAGVTAQIVQLTADLLDYWPRLVEIAHELRISGERISRALP
ncbi:MAG TPA: hypothetical protein VHC72_04775 [Bryobacteraceae bacterium]|nr:hypothetical protein [Bryobacteraceae bacterium]